MKNYLALLMLSFLTLPAFAQPCGKFLQTYNLWEDEINGQIVLKHSVFEIPDWDPNSQYESFVLTSEAVKSVKKPVLEVEFKGTKTGKKRIETFRRVQPLTQDSTLSAFDDFKAGDFFQFKEAGNYTVRLKDDSALICAQNFKYGLGH